MELQLRLSDKNRFLLAGIFIKAEALEQWVKEIQRMGFALNKVKVYPLPGKTANSVWGCLVITESWNKSIDIGKNQYCQLVHQILFIPERTTIFPEILTDELARILHNKQHVFHPDFGLLELEQEMEWKQMIELPTVETKNIIEPSAGVYRPSQIKTFQVKSVSPDEIENQMEEQLFPKREKFKDKPLNILERMKLFFYEQLFTKTADNKTGGNSSIERKPLFSVFERVRNFFSKNTENWARKMEEDYEQLEKRNQKHLDRLMELLKKDPAEALKYAIPLDSDGTGRGGSALGSFLMEKRWFDFSLFGNSAGGGGRAVSISGAYDQLFEQYTKTALALIEQGDYQKAAFVYMKLLKNYQMAAKTLEDGKYFAEAAAVYFKYCHNKTKAAECFEKANMTDKAIELYKELNDFEKVGDLYASIHKRQDALFYYQKRVDEYELSEQCVKASLLYREKMGRPGEAKNVLLKGWRSNKDAFNCMCNYLATTEEEKERWADIQNIRNHELNEQNIETFIRVLQNEFAKSQTTSENIRDMAYELIASHVAANPSVVSELKPFNKADNQLVKDTIRFKLNVKK